jgi:hypothetical protein
MATPSPGRHLAGVLGRSYGRSPSRSERRVADQSAMAHADGTDPTVRGGLLAGSDNLVRRLRARGELD